MTRAAPPLLARLAGLDLRVGRATYLGWGIALAAFKFALDNLVVHAGTGRFWSPLDYLVPSLFLRAKVADQAPVWMLVVLAVQALPFLWIGVSMSVRRSADAGRSPWYGLLFLVPFVNYLVIAWLGVLPSTARPQWESPPTSVYRESETSPPSSGRGKLADVYREGIVAIAAGIGVALSMIALCVYGLSTYGGAIFFFTPFAMGVVSALLFNRRAIRSWKATVGVAFFATALAGSTLLFAGVEGVICIAMAVPIAGAAAVLGAILARAIVMRTRRARDLRSLGGGPLMALAPVLPLLAIFESAVATPTAREVTTTIEVDAPPAKVWENVVHFSELRPPPEWVFRLGIAYPVRARIEPASTAKDGKLGVGAIRRCEFSTGPFVEPITVWEPPRRLAFDVTAQPPSMHELSPWNEVHAPHLEGYMVSHGGEFRLTELPGHRTRLEGTTHYTLAIFPEIYWTPWAELVLHAIHRRVLEHVKGLSEGAER